MASLPSEESLPETPHQPASFSFPKRDFGKRKRSFQASWFHSWSWLHYNEAKDCVFCHLCCKAIKEKHIVLKPGATDAAFVSSCHFLFCIDIELAKFFIYS